MKKIYVKKSNRALLVAKYGAKNVSVALNFKSDSFMSREIRKKALEELGGNTYLVTKT